MATLSVVGRKKGKITQAFIYYWDGSKGTQFYTGVSVPNMYFQKKHGQWIKSAFAGSQSRNKTIKDKYSQIDDILSKNIGASCSELREKVDGSDNSKEATEMLFEELYSEYLNNLPGKKESTYTAKNSALLHWKDFSKSKQYKVKELTPAIYDKLRSFLLKEFAPATVGKTIKDIKACLNWANERGYLDAETLGTINLTLWKTKKQKPQNIHYLELDELQKVIDYQPKSNYLKKAKDLLILQSNTGLRISDLKTITRSGDTIRMKTKKTNEIIQVPLTSKAKEILEKYNNQAPKISDQKFNEYMKSLLMKVGIDRKVDMPRHQFEKLNETRKKRVLNWQKEQGYFALPDSETVPAPFYELASSHSNVRTFITLAAELGMTPKVIATITGKTVKVILENYLGTSDKTLQREMNAFDSAFKKLTI
ncbi:tyrosine-type recombinase/integrase [Fulvivirga sedimenti]|uniref:Phage integrase SAM-like domain-containing protein n=1 Tax=Fulvivirga sedimenti TaxID=2879465 RepID=A0A9X1HV21_9BACT|nr:phage integrase SAM-like domain-containing protein [Fulvivirga sedimenti]MCA6078819.1 phage integrase SAM-like domain-containing protein [Fulvivirga sedimenti]